MVLIRIKVYLKSLVGFTVRNSSYLTDFLESMHQDQIIMRKKIHQGVCLVKDKLRNLMSKMMIVLNTEIL